MQAILYSNRNQECDRAKSLLKSLKIDYVEYFFDIHFSDKGFREEFGEDAQYPQVTIDYDGFRHKGGLKEALRFFKDHNIFK